MFVPIIYFEHPKLYLHLTCCFAVLFGLCTKLQLGVSLRWRTVMRSMLCFTKLEVGMAALNFKLCLHIYMYGKFMSGRVFVKWKVTILLYVIRNGSYAELEKLSGGCVPMILWTFNAWLSSFECYNMLSLFWYSVCVYNLANFLPSKVLIQWTHS